MIISKPESNLNIIYSDLEKLTSILNLSKSYLILNDKKFDSYPAIAIKRNNQNIDVYKEIYRWINQI